MDAEGWHQVKIERGVVTVVLHGEFDMAEATELTNTLCPLVAIPGRVVRVDMSDVAFFGSVALRVILSARAMADDAGSSFIIVDPSLSCQRLFDVAGVTTALRLELPITRRADLATSG